MSQQEINADAQSATDAQIKALLLDVHTAIPAIVISFNAEQRTVQAQPAIKRIFREKGAVNLPPCVDVPVYFPSGGGFELTFPVAKNDHCLLIFSERCIDGWWATGEILEPQDFRQHDLSDAFALVGVWPRGKRPAVWTGGAEFKGENCSLRLSNSEAKLSFGSSFLTLDDEKLETNRPIHAPNLVTPMADFNDHKHPVGSTTTGTPTL